LGNELVSNSVGYCKQKKLRLFVTETVKNEALTKLPRIVNRYFDRTGIRAHPVRHNMYLKIRKRLLELIGSVDVKNTTSDIHQVEAMFMRFTKDPKLFKKFQELKYAKKRSNILPSTTDMQILGEAHILAQDHKTYLITDDGDYIDFKDEIKNELNVTVVPILDLPHFEEIYNRQNGA
jgi:hypothetical protein